MFSLKIFTIRSSSIKLNIIMFSSLSQIVNGIKIAVLKESCNKIRAAKVRGADDSIPVRFLTFCKCRISLSCKLPAPRDNAADPDPHGSP
jgi:hypothetical protein